MPALQPALGYNFSIQRQVRPTFDCSTAVSVLLLRFCRKLVLYTMPFLNFTGNILLYQLMYILYFNNRMAVGTFDRLFSYVQRLIILYGFDYRTRLPLKRP